MVRAIVGHSSCGSSRLDADRDPCHDPNSVITSLMVRPDRVLQPMSVPMDLKERSSWPVQAARLSGLSVAFIGSYWLVAWFGGWVAVWAAAGQITVKTNMALCQLLGGVALLLLADKPDEGKRLRQGVAAVLAVTILVIGGLTLAEHLFGVDLGIDQLIATEPFGAAATVSPNRVGPPGSASLTLLGIGLLALAGRRSRVPSYVGLTVCLIVLVPAVGFLYGIQQFYSLPRVTGIAWPTVLAMLALGLGLALADHERGALALLLRDDPGGALLRRLLPPMLVALLALGLVHVEGERRSWYSAENGAGLMVLILAVAFSVLLWRGASHLSRSAVAEARARQEASHRLEEIESLLKVSPIAVFIAHDSGCARITGNPAGYRLVGLPDAERGNISKSAPLEERPTYRVFREGRELAPEELPMQLAASRGVDVLEDSLELLFVDGSRKYLFAYATPLFDLAGQTRGAIGAMLDITESRRAQSELEADLAALTRSHELSERRLGTAGLQPLLQEVMDAAVAIMGAQFGTLQVLEADESLRIVAHYGHRQPFLDFFAEAENRASVCGEAMRCGRRVVVSNIEVSPLFAGTPSLGVLREAGVRAVQSTPMLSRAGGLLGILTTQWSCQYVPNERDLWRVDLLVRQAADLIESAKAAEELRRKGGELAEAQRIAHVGSWFWDAETDVMTGSDELLRIYGFDPATQTMPDFKRQRGRCYPVEEWDRLNAAVQEAVQTGIGYELDVQAFRGDIPICLTTRSELVRDADGRVLGLRGTVQDVTERKKRNKRFGQVKKGYACSMPSSNSAWPSGPQSCALLQLN